MKDNFEVIQFNAETRGKQGCISVQITFLENAEASRKTTIANCSPYYHGSVCLRIFMQHRF